MFYPDVGRRVSRCQYEIEIHVFVYHHKSQFHQNLVSTSKIHLASVTKVSPLMLFRKIIDVFCNLIKHINTLCEQNAETNF